MDVSVLANKLDNVIAQLKAMGGGFTSTKDVKGNIKGKFTREEAEKIKLTAYITANAYKKILGLGFNPKDATETAKIFNNVIGFSKFFDYIADSLDIVIDNIGKVDKTKSKKDSSYQLINKLIKGLEWFDLKDAIMLHLDRQQYLQRELNFGISKLVHLTEDSKKPKKKEDGGMASFKNLAGLAIIGIGLFLIINALANAGKIDIMKTIKVLGVLALLIGIFILVGKMGSGLKNAAIGFGILSATIAFLVIPLIEKLEKMKFSVLLEGLAKFALVVGVCIGLMILMKKIKKSDVIVATAGLAILGLIVGFLLIPLFQRLAEISWEVILDGLSKFTLIVGVCIGLMWLMGTIKKGNVIVATAAMVVLVFLIGYLADQLEKYAYKPWDAITEGLKIAGIAFGAFFAMFALIAVGTKLIGKAGMAVTGVIMFELVYLVGYLADQLEKYANKPWDSIIEGLKIAGIAFGTLVTITGILAVAMAAGGPIGLIAGAVAGGVVLALAYALGVIADSLTKYQTINGDSLIQVAKGMVAIAGGLALMLVGTGAGIAGGIANGLAGLIGVDPVSYLKKFEKLDAEKMLTLGTGMKFLAEGLRSLSQGIELKDITTDIANMTAPLVQFSSALVAFASAYKELDKVKMEAEMNQMYKMNVQNDSGIQKAILEINQQELAVQQAQLDQLRANGDLLRQIVQKGGTGGNGMNITPPPNSTTISSPSFNTKDNYMSNLKLTNMTIGN